MIPIYKSPPAMAIGVIAFIFIFASGGMNAMFYASFGITPQIAIVMIAVSIAFDSIKPFAFVKIQTSLQERDWGLASIWAIVAVITVIASLIAAIGFMATTRSGTSAKNESAIAKYESAKKTEAEAEAAMTRMGAVPDITTIKSQIAAIAAKINKGIAKPVQCIAGQKWGPRRRKWCPDIHRLQAQIPKAQAFDAANRRAIEARKIISQGKPADEADPHAAAIAHVIRTSIKDTQVGIVWFFSFAVEFMAAVGMMLANNARRRAKPKPVTPVAQLTYQPGMTVSDWFSQRADQGGRVVAHNKDVAEFFEVSPATAGRWIRAEIARGIISRAGRTPDGFVYKVA